ncbi:MAG: DUF167 domain-containing protein [Acidobacteriaceae bacterium]
MSKIIKVRVHTKAFEDRVEEVGLDEYEAWVSSVPEGGKANDDLIELLSEHFDTPPSTIRIKSGGKSRHKLIEID